MNTFHTVAAALHQHLVLLGLLAIVTVLGLGHALPGGRRD